MTQRDVLLNVRSKIQALHDAIPKSYAEGQRYDGSRVMQGMRNGYREAITVIDLELDRIPPLVVTYEASPDMDSGGAG